MPTYVLYRGKGQWCERITAGSVRMCQDTLKRMKARNPADHLWIGYSSGRWT
jgi:hypothetical protein